MFTMCDADEDEGVLDKIEDTMEQIIDELKKQLSTLDFSMV